MLRRDRFELTLLALGLFGWALLVAPLVHAIGHGHSHSHPGSLPGATHGEGSFEHGKALLSAPPVLPSLNLIVVASLMPRTLRPGLPHVAGQRHSAQPQGP